MNRTVYLIHPDHGETVVFDEHQFRYLTEQRGWKVKPLPEPKPEPVPELKAFTPLADPPKPQTVTVKTDSVLKIAPRRGRPPKKG